MIFSVADFQRKTVPCRAKVSFFFLKNTVSFKNRRFQNSDFFGLFNPEKYFQIVKLILKIVKFSHIELHLVLHFLEKKTVDKSSL